LTDSNSARGADLPGAATAKLDDWENRRARFSFSTVAALYSVELRAPAADEKEKSAHAASRASPSGAKR